MIQSISIRHDTKYSTPSRLLFWIQKVVKSYPVRLLQSSNRLPNSPRS